MKRTLLTLVLALGFPLAGLAQQGPPPEMADHAKMMQMHAQARGAVLAALTPAHKTLLASVVSGLAVSTNPDTKAAAAKLDAALSASEKKAIVDTESRMHEQMESMMPSPPPGASAHHMQMSTDPGEILLMMAAMNIMGSDGMMHAMPH